jgi:hypothetical protein
MANTVPIIVLGGASGPPVSVAVEQAATGYFLYADTRKFGDPAKATGVLISVPPGQPGTFFAGDLRLDLAVDPSRGWSDGRYTVYYVDARSGMKVDAESFDVVGGQWRPLTATDTAARLLDANAPNTLRLALAKVDAIYRWASKQPGFSA